MLGWIARISLLVALGIAPAAFGQGIQMQCGAQEGMGYSASRGGEPAEWYSDKISNGQTLIRLKDSGEAEVLYIDSLKVWRSAKDDGATVELHNITSNPMGITVLVVYPQATIEVLIVTDFEDDSATLTHSVSRNLEALTNARIFTATCKISDF